MADYPGKDEILSDLQQRVDDKILEPSNYHLLKKLVDNADTLDEAIKIAELGTTYRRTGFQFDKKLEKQSNTISHFKKNEELSFTTDASNTTHKLIIGDNYPALLNLLIEYKAKVDVIYIDPPYGKDSMGEFAQTNYENAISRDNLLSMLYPRLWLAKRLLSENGVIFCSIDDKNQAYVKGLFDEVFGESNFIGTLPRLTSAQRPSQETYFSIQHDYILVYSAHKSAGNFARVIERDVEDIQQDKNGQYFKGDTSPILASSTQGYSEGGDYDFEFNGKVYSPVDSKGTRRRWLWTIDRMKQAKELGILVKTKTTLRVQNYIDKEFQVGTNKLVEKEANLILHTNDLMDKKFVNNKGTKALNDLGLNGNFIYPKPVDLMTFLIKLHPNKDSLVLDFFAGSGTTGQAVLELNKIDGGNRKFVVVTNNEVTDVNPNGIAYDVTSRRLKRVMTGEDYDGDKNFKWLETNKPLGDNLLTLDLAEVASFEATAGKTPFDVIDETLYGQEKLGVNEKVEWVSKNFEQTQKRLEDN